MQDCSNSSALAMELLQSCAKPSICNLEKKKKKIQNLIAQLVVLLTMGIVAMVTVEPCSQAVKIPPS